MRDNLVLPEDVEFWVRVVNDEAPAVIDNSALTVIKETGGEFYETAMKVMTAKEEWDGLCRLVGEATDRRGKRLFLPLRAALCGRTDGPTMAAIFGLLSEKKVRARFLAAAQYAAG